MVGEEPQAMEELREVAQHQLAVCSSRLLGSSTYKTFNTLLGQQQSLEFQR